VTCQLRNEPIGAQVAAARRRLAMVPPELRVKRGKKILTLAPAGTTWCAGCQSFRDLEDFAKGVTQCRACASAKSHAAMIKKTYGLKSDDYDVLLEAQGGRCAICRARPKSKRLAVDHDHKTGAVRGLLCSRCNHDLMGSAWDSLALVVALWHYLNTPPASGEWTTPEKAPAIGILETGGKAVAKPSGAPPLVTAHGRGTKAQALDVAGDAPECAETHYRPAGSVADPHGAGYWRVYVEDGEEVAPPF
jgi:hypothetical protein